MAAYSANHDLNIQIKAVLLADPAFISAVQQLVQNHVGPIAVPGVGIIPPSNARFNADGSYVLPSAIPPTHELEAPIERLEFLFPHVPTYLELVRKVLDLRPYQETAVAKGKVVADLEISITTDEARIKDLEARLAKEERELQNPQGFSFKSAKSKISASNIDSTETFRQQIAQREQTLRDTKAKLEKAKIGSQLTNSDSAAFMNSQRDLIKLLNEASISFSFR
ncbi:hypothetical protein HDU97_002690 [Phlyctochytrium planicorne]|nr:hypothetical protein HDU97_002690 [Phlyctochytrium planicorne]